MSDLKVNFGTLSAAAADISTGAGRLESTLADMDSQLGPLKANWVGEAASAYDTAKIKWTTAITDMKTLLSQIGTAVDGSGQDYQTTELNNARLWG